MTTPLIDACARAIHDGPLGAGDYTFDGPSKNEQECSAWCREVARAVIPLVLDAAAEVANGFDWEVYGDRIAEAILALKPEAQS